MNIIVKTTIGTTGSLRKNTMRLPGAAQRRSFAVDGSSQGQAFVGKRAGSATSISSFVTCVSA
jgi:hypothetical protein